MDAMQRRLIMFRDELQTDIPNLQTMLDEEEYEHIRLFAHKYKMRLDYFGYADQLEMCKQIVSDHKEGKVEDQKINTIELIQSLKEIAQKLNDESTDC